MPSNSCDSTSGTVSPGARRMSGMVAIAAAVTMLGAGLLISTDDLGERIKPWPPGSWLVHVVRAQSLWYSFPTAHFTEIKNVVFQIAAGVVSLAAAGWCLIGGRHARTDSRPRPWWRQPAVWLVALGIISFISVAASNASRAAAGGSVIRLFWLLWWWPLALLLTRRHARWLALAMIGAATLTAAVGLWHYAVRVEPGRALTYPFGNALPTAAFFTPPLMIAATLLVGAVCRKSQRRRRFVSLPSLLALLACCGVLGYAIELTASRSARLGVGFGIISIVYLLADRLVRDWLKVCAALIVGGIGSMLIVTGGDTLSTTLAVVDRLSSRSASIRARVAHEWPYAVELFKQAPWIGHGEGGFGRLAGSMAREHQYEDPALLQMDGRVWESHAHNELLETLDSVGLLGTAALLMALGLTLKQAARSIETRRPGMKRVWIVALSGALVAGWCEELTSIALHVPGFAPILWGTWALLWALIRGDTLQNRARKLSDLTRSSEAMPPQRVEAESPNKAALRTAMARIGWCVTALVSTVSVGLAYSNAQACRRYFTAERMMKTGQFAEAIAPADYAAAWQLDPTRYLSSLQQAAFARLRMAKELSASQDQADRQAALRFGEQALQRVDALDRAAPRYLKAAEIRGFAASIVAYVLVQLDSMDAARQSEQMAREAFRQNREDEPFRITSVNWLWQADPLADATTHLQWLRDLLRGGEIQNGFDMLLATMLPDALPQLRAMVDAARSDWKAANANRNADPAPETIRLAARSAWLQHRYVDAATLAIEACNMYAEAEAEAGGRLNVPRGAAIHELVQYRFAAEPGHVDDLLTRLNEAYELVEAVPADGPLTGPMAFTRLMLLCGDPPQTAAAEAQAERLAAQESGGDDPTIQSATAAQIHAAAYLRLIDLFADRLWAAGDPRALDWARRAAELDSSSVGPPRALVAQALRAGRDDEARSAIDTLILVQPDQESLNRTLGALRAQYPNSRAWNGLSILPDDAESPNERRGD